jgi:hypothetical protein
MRRPSWLNSAVCTGVRCLIGGHLSFPVIASHNLTVPSLEALNTDCPPGAKAMVITRVPCCMVIPRKRRGWTFHTCATLAQEAVTTF